jgi:hypothetical protein
MLSASVDSQVLSPSSQAFDALLPVWFFEGLYPFIDVRLPPTAAISKSR